MWQWVLHNLAVSFGGLCLEASRSGREKNQAGRLGKVQGRCLGPQSSQADSGAPDSEGARRPRSLVVAAAPHSAPETLSSVG